MQASHCSILEIVKSPWAADEDKFCQKKGAMMRIALHSSVYQTDDIDDDVVWLSSYEPVWARGWSIYRAEAHCGPPASLAQLNSVCFDFPGCWPSVLSILITITHKDGGVVYLQITLFINIYSWLLTLDLEQPLHREGSRQIALEYSAKIADGRYGDIFTLALVMHEYENKDLGISGALAQTAKVATIDKVADGWWAGPRE